MNTRVIGERIKRSEDPRLLVGKGVYVDDIHLLGMAHGAVLRSPHAKARILGIDASRALALPGVLAVITAADLGHANSPMPLLFLDRGFIFPRTHRALAIDQVRFHGEAVAFVVAESRYIAEDALELIDVSYQTSQAAVDLIEATRSGAPLVHDDTDSNIACRTATEYGDLASAFAKASFVLREELRPERGCAQPMETRGAVADFDARTGKLTLWDSTQAPIPTRGILAEKLEMAEADITVIAPDVGGGFGVKIMLLYAEEVLVPFAARLLKRPVKWIEDRHEHFIGSNHERLMVHDVEVAVMDDGRITALKDVFLYDSGAYCPYGPVNAECCQGILPGPYKIPNIYTEYVAVYTNTPIVSPYRGAGQPHAVFVMETIMNRIATRLGLDVAEVRRRNLVTPADCPWNAGVVFQGNSPLIHRDCDYPAQFDLLLDALGYQTFREQQARARANGIYKGVGLAFYVEGTGIASYEGVEVCVEPTGFVRVTTGYPSQGQGHATTISQIVAEELGVDMSNIVFQQGNSDRFAWGGATFASRGTVIGGTAAVRATRKVRERALAMASDMLEVSPIDLEIVSGVVRVKGVHQMCTDLKTLALAAAMPGLEPGDEPGLRATGFFRPVGGTFSSGVHAMVVDVDLGTGVVTIDRHVVVHDCGVMINPTIVEGQIFGGTAQGIGGAHYEKLWFSPTGELLTTSFADYIMPTAMEIPFIEIHHLDRASSLNPLGVKGVGEGGAIPVPAAFAGAVEDALTPLGVSISAVPLTAPMILEHIRKAQKKLASLTA
jgi:carbon-monoxide dehydrogenase large subunit